MTEMADRLPVVERDAVRPVALHGEDGMLPFHTRELRAPELGALRRGSDGWAGTGPTREGGPRSEPDAGRAMRPGAAGSDEALCRTRTDDPFLTMEVLYQLS